MISSVALIVRENINLRRGFWYARFAPCQREDDSAYEVGLGWLVLTGEVGIRRRRVPSNGGAVGTYVHKSPTEGEYAMMNGVGFRLSTC